MFAKLRQHFSCAILQKLQENNLLIVRFIRTKVLSSAFELFAKLNDKQADNSSENLIAVDIFFYAITVVLNNDAVVYTIRVQPIGM